MSLSTEATSYEPDILAYDIETGQHVRLSSVLREIFESDAAGGTDSKALVTGILGKTSLAGNKVALERASFIERHVIDPGYLLTWHGMRSTGTPVLYPVYHHVGRQALLTPDLKADGSELYGKGLDVSLATAKQRPYPRHRPRPEIDALFLDIATDGNLRDLEDQAMEYATNDAATGLRWPVDDTFELHVRPDGSYGMMYIDVGMGTFENAAPLPANQEMAQQFIIHLKNIRKGLLEARA